MSAAAAAPAAPAAAAAPKKKTASSGKKGAKKATQKFTIDCSEPAADEIFDIASFVSRRESTAATLRARCAPRLATTGLDFATDRGSAEFAALDRGSRIGRCFEERSNRARGRR